MVLSRKKDIKSYLSLARHISRILFPGFLLPGFIPGSFP